MSWLRTALSYAGIPQYQRDAMDPLTYRRGKGIAICDKPRAEIDKICQELRERTGQRVDWHYMGGRGVIRALGDTERVKEIYYEIISREKKVHS